MNEIVEKEKCCGCYACYNICPKHAITFVESKDGFMYPKIDESKCINCGLCKKVCNALNKKELKNDIKAYAAKNKNDSERLNSSSGGIFILIAKYILNNNGVVYGAAFDDDFNVKHIRVDSLDNISQLMTSKYVQSQIKDTYCQAKKDLNAGKLVLFTGTPCQIEGLKLYLMKDYDNLFTQDLICHGVPSPKVWNKYKEYRLQKDGQKPEKISFRNKDNGWRLSNMKFSYKKDNYKKNQNEDKFMNAFLRNTILRNSCYNCSAKKLNRVSDITLADFWGIDNFNIDFDDNKGTSLVIVNSEKGRKIYSEISKYILSKEVDFNEAIKYNQSMIKSVSKDKNRDKFFENLDSMDFDKLVDKYTSKPNLICRVKNKIKRIIKKIINKG